MRYDALGQGRQLFMNGVVTNRDYFEEIATPDDRVAASKGKARQMPTIPPISQPAIRPNIGADRLDPRFPFEILALSLPNSRWLRHNRNSGSMGRWEVDCRSAIIHSFDLNICALIRRGFLGTDFRLFRVDAFAVLTETKDYCGWGTCHLDLKHFSLNFGSLP
jgi:hypothetical protein